ncbi:MAG TPA: NADH-quinone oxidoreductase subunit G [Actinopolymorphaceae bacterium]|jgi:NADH-quinone oxidoreductase subunit G
MTTTSQSPAELAARDDLVTLTIDDIEVSVPKGTLLIRAAELIGIEIPRFCDHPLLDPVGACRQCLVEIPDAGNGRGMPKPQASCTIEVAPNMVVRTQLSSPVAEKAQRGQMEFLLMNHPLDCPICDKGGECPLQNQAMSNGQVDTRFEFDKRVYPKPLPISEQVLLDRERCVLCARCTRFSKQIAGDPMIELLERGALQQVGIYEKEPFRSYFSGNTIQICPVGALTSADYRFRARPFDLVSTGGTCEHCASGCDLRVDHRGGVVQRRQAGDDPEVNEEWLCDKGRFAFRYADGDDRITHPHVRGEDGELRAASWSEALRVAAAGLAAAAGKVGVLPGGRLTNEDAYAYSKFARIALRTNDIDSRARPGTDEELAFLGAGVAGTGLGVTFTDLEKAPAVLLVDFEAEDEGGIVFLRLRKAAQKSQTMVFSIASHATKGLTKMSGTLIPAVPGDEAAVLDALAASSGEGSEPVDVAAAAVRAEGSVILVGERAGVVPGALAAAVALSAATGARLAWIPRRAGERGAIDAGCLPTLLPGGRPVADAAARIDVAADWGVDSLSATPGRDTAGILAAAAAGDLGALVIGGVEHTDLADAAAALAAIETARFVVSLEVRASAITERADVVFPVAPVAEKPGTFTNWEGRTRTFGVALSSTGAVSDLRVLATLADSLGAPLGLPDAATARAELAELTGWDGARTVGPTAARAPGRAPGEVALATWTQLLDAGRMQDGVDTLAKTAPPALIHLAPAVAAQLGAVDGDSLTVTRRGGSITLPLAIDTSMAAGVVWVPTNSREGGNVRARLGAVHGSSVRLAKAAGANGVGYTDDADGGAA